MSGCMLPESVFIGVEVLCFEVFVDKVVIACVYARWWVSECVGGCVGE